MRDDGWNALWKGLVGDDGRYEAGHNEVAGGGGARMVVAYYIRHDTTPVQQDQINLRRGLLMRNGDRVYYDRDAVYIRSF